MSNGNLNQKQKQKRMNKKNLNRKTKQCDVSLTYLLLNLDTEKITLTGDATGLFDFYELVPNEETGENEEQTASMSWGLPRETNNIALIAEGKQTGDGKLIVTHSPSGAKAEVPTGVLQVNIILDELAEDQEENPGAFVGVKKRKSLSLEVEPTNAGGNAVLALDNKLKLYDAATEGNEITMREWSAVNLPTGLYVEGVSASSSVRDQEAKLTWHEKSDKVKITVVGGVLTPDSLTDFDIGTREGNKTYIHWNIDNDDDSQQSAGAPKHPGGDYLQDSYNTTISDNDMEKILLSILPVPDDLKSGKVKLTVGNGVRLWYSRDKGIANLLVDGETFEWDLSQAADRSNFNIFFRGVFVEGTNKGTNNFKLEYIPPVGNGFELDNEKYHFISANCGRQPYLSIYNPISSDRSRNHIENNLGLPLLKNHRCEYSITALASSQYNCISWTLGITNDWLWPESPDLPTIDYFDDFYDDNGYEICDDINEADIILYHKNSVIVHAARRIKCGCGDGKWLMYESKVGTSIRLEHRVHHLDNGNYGVPFRYYKHK
ncbi:MAG: hypothetical protein LBG58_03000 [Planctomycetaceae bacterium]|jgi:hypothetical protein|nr:hypothetical protein [Planctomycetaceae bacterium]